MGDEEYQELDVKSDTSKRAQRNLMERQRRKNLKDIYSILKDSVPALEGEKPSRIQILEKSTEYIVFMKNKNSLDKKHIEGLKRQNSFLKAQIKILEENKSTKVSEHDASNEIESDLLSTSQ